MTESHKVKMALKAQRRNDYHRMTMASFVSPKRKVHEREREIARHQRQANPR